MALRCSKSQLTYCSQIWRPHLLKDISSLERIQRRATKFILRDFHSDYKSRLTSLHLLPLMMQLELYDIMFFTNCLKNDRKSKTFCVHSYVTLSTSSTLSATHFKLKHSLSKSNTIAHLYFNRLPRLWNSLPTIDLDLPISVIKWKLTTFFWDHFNANFHCNNPCTFHILCPCAKCVRLPIKSYSSSL